MYRKFSDECFGPFALLTAIKVIALVVLIMQHDLFEHDPAIRQLIGHIDNIPAPELESRWPRSVVDLIDVLENELKRQNVSNPRELARKQAVALSCFLGGRQFYIPCGDTILTALRDDLLYCQFNGRNMEELRRQYRLSQPQIYQIIARQRKLHTRRHQPDLFSPESQK